MLRELFSRHIIGGEEKISGLSLRGERARSQKQGNLIAAYSKLKFEFT